MHPARVDRQRVQQLTDLPNVGPACARDLQLLGIQSPAQLRGRDAYAMYRELCARSGQRHDPCVIDVFLSITDFIEGGAPQPWWAYTAARKQALAAGGVGP